MLLRRSAGPPKLILMLMLELERPDRVFRRSAADKPKLLVETRRIDVLSKMKKGKTKPGFND